MRSSQLSWHRSLLFSCAIHFGLLIIAGLMAHNVTLHAQSIEYVILELVDQPVAAQEPSGGTGSAQPQLPGDPAVTKAEKPAAKMQQPAAQAQSSTEAVVDTFVSNYIQTSGGSDTGNSSGTGKAGGESSGTNGGGSGKGGSGSGAQGGNGSGGFSPPSILRKVEPEYPEQARCEGVEGAVGIRMEVLENGRTGEVWVQRSSGSPLLDDAALRAVREWRFAPARDGTGRAVRCITVFSVKFHLQ